MPISPVIASLLEKAAVDNGFDQELRNLSEQDKPRDWIGFASTQCSLRIWLGVFADATFVAAFSQQNVSIGLSEFGAVFDGTLPNGAIGARSVVNIPELHHLVRRSFQLSKTLPDELLNVFVKTTALLPKSTEAERLVVQRLGQDIFRAGLLEYWEGRCSVTGLALPRLLRASHIKPWADCETDSERLDVYNGLLLAPHLDAAFDGGFITITNDGAVVVSSSLGPTDRRILGLADPLRVPRITDGHRAYLFWHRARIFRQ